MAFAAITPALQLSLGQRFKLNFNPIASASGGPGALDPGVIPVWSVDNPTAIHLGPSEDGLVCRVLAVAYGNARITCSTPGNKVPNVIATVLVTPTPIPLPPADAAMLTATKVE